MAARPQAVIIAGPYAGAATIVKQAHMDAWHPQFLTVSFVGTEEFIKEAGSDAEGTIITQVMPPYDHTDYATVALYRQCLTKYSPRESPTFVSLEGFVDAMVMVEGLKRAGKELTRGKFIAGIESIHQMNAGLGPKLILHYSASDHKGFDSGVSDDRKERTARAAHRLVRDQVTSRFVFPAKQYCATAALLVVRTPRSTQSCAQFLSAVRKKATSFLHSRNASSLHTPASIELTE